MKHFLFALSLAFTGFKGFSASDNTSIDTNARFKTVQHQDDSVKLIVDGNNVYYQKTVKLDSDISEAKIYLRAVQFMAAKNIQQNYGYQEEGKIIFSTTQDLNENKFAIEDENDPVRPYSVQFAITLDLKNGRYRYTIHNVLFFLPTDNGNKRETLYELCQKATNTDSRRIAREAKNLMDSFERYLSALTNELRVDIEHKSLMHKPDF
jgi:hypothetical protein